MATGMKRGRIEVNHAWCAFRCCGARYLESASPCSPFQTQDTRHVDKDKREFITGVSRGSRLSIFKRDLSIVSSPMVRVDEKLLRHRVGVVKSESKMAAF